MSVSAGCSSYLLSRGAPTVSLPGPPHLYPSAKETQRAKGYPRDEEEEEEEEEDGHGPATSAAVTTVTVGLVASCSVEPGPATYAHTAAAPRGVKRVL